MGGDNYKLEAKRVTTESQSFILIMFVMWVCWGPMPDSLTPSQMKEVLEELKEIKIAANDIIESNDEDIDLRCNNARYLAREIPRIAQALKQTVEENEKLTNDITSLRPQNRRLQDACVAEGKKNKDLIKELKETEESYLHFLEIVKKTNKENEKLKEKAWKYDQLCK